MVIKQFEGKPLSGRDFEDKDFRLIKETISLCSHLSRTELAKTICENLGWYQSNGEPKYRACLKVLEKLEGWGSIKLPLLKDSALKGYGHKIEITEKTAPGNALNGRIDEYPSVVIEPVEDKEGAGLWKEYVQRYHYLGYRIPFGCQQKYFIRFTTGELLGCMLYSASAWSVQCRDKWIGWDREEKSKRLHRIINNSRFLLFNWIRIKNLASKVLSIAVREIPKYWEKKYNYRPVLMETFVDSRFSGVCYRSANWRHLGVTKGRGRMDRYTQYLSTVKDVYVYPLSPSFREALKGGEEQ